MERLTEEPEEREGENERLGEEEFLTDVLPELCAVLVFGLLVTVVRVELSRVGVLRVFLFMPELVPRRVPRPWVPVLACVPLFCVLLFLSRRVP